MLLRDTVTPHPTHLFPRSPQDGEDNDNFGGYGGGNRRRRNMYGQEPAENPDPLTAYFASQSFQSIMSWSHHVSGVGVNWRYRAQRATIGEISVSRYSDRYTAMLYISSLRNEIFPVAFIRSIGEPNSKGIVTIYEYELRNACVSNLSVNGSSGSRYQESISLSFMSFFSRHVELDTSTGDVRDITTGYWDEESEIGSRTGVQEIGSLSYLCRRVVSQNFTIYDKRVRLLL